MLNHPDASMLTETHDAKSGSGFLKGNAKLFFLVLCVVQLLITYAMQQVVLTNDVLAATLGSEISVNGVNQIIEQKSQWAWLSYAVVPVTLLIGISFVALCHYIVILFNEKSTNDKVWFSNIASFVTSAYAVFIIKSALIFFIAAYLVDITEVQDMQKVDLFSLAALVPVENYDAWWAIPLRTFDLFEILFMVLLTIGVSEMISVNKGQSFKLVLSSYGVGLLLWVLCLRFLRLSFV
jgi:hypothetical protein